MYEELKQQLFDYNWDDGFSFPQNLLNNDECDLALALDIFYLADGYGYIQNYPNVDYGTEDWLNFGSITKLMGFRIPHIINSAHINEF